jgi:DNA-binding protein H-NS
MGLKETTNKLKEYLCQIAKDIDKAERGNKAASQRVRTGTIRLEKIAKLFRKESIAAEKKGGIKKAPKKAAAKKGKAKPAKAKPAKKSGGAKKKKKR